MKRSKMFIEKQDRVEKSFFSTKTVIRYLAYTSELPVISLFLLFSKRQIDINVVHHNSFAENQ